MTSISNLAVQDELQKKVIRVMLDKMSVLNALPGTREEVWKKSGLSWSRFLYVWGLTRDERWQVTHGNGFRWERKSK